MKWFSIAILVVAVFAFSPAKSVQANSFSFSVGFHDELSPYGSWVNYSNYGQCWRPSAYSGYRPYTDGYWNYSSYGPQWYGNESWAPYTYNYGNWIYTARYGWIWIPGYDYHANYVDWSYGGGYIGWRPTFPSGYYYPGNDYNLWIVINSNNWGYQNYRPYVLGTSYVRDLWTRRVFRQRYDRIGRTELERVVRRPIRTVSLREREVRIGNRRTRMLVTPDQEVRIQKHVQQVRRSEPVRRYDNNDLRRSNERETVMKHKFDEIRSKEKSSRDFKSSKDFDRERDNRSKDVRRDSKDYRKDSDNRNRKEFDTRKYDSKKSYSKPRHEEKRKPEPPSRSNFSRFDEKRSSVKSLESHSRKASKPERASYSFHKSDNHKDSSRQITKTEHSRKEVRTTKTTKKESQKRHKPPTRH